MTEDEEWVASFVPPRAGELDGAYSGRTSEISRILAQLNSGGVEIGKAEELYRRLCELTGADAAIGLRHLSKK